MPDAVVIGAGIGGLTSAVALSQQGWTVTVLEQAASIEPVGSGLAIAPNALRVLDTIGVGDEVRKLSAIQGQAGIRRPDGRWLSRADADAMIARYGDPVVLLLRATLVDLLAVRLPPGALHLNRRVESIDPEAGRVVTDGGTVEGDLIVAADGIRSVARRTLFPGHPEPRYAGVTSWRIVVPAGQRAGSPSGAITASETWGAGTIFGVAPLAEGQVYCYATHAVPPGGHAASEKDELLRLFGDWHDPIPALLAAADPAAVLRHDIYSLDTPLPAFHRGRVALVGDAAHAMAPNLGQGACQAIEDAVVLAREAGTASKAGRAVDLAAYSAARVARATRIARRSRSLGRLTQWRRRPVVALRDTLLLAMGALGTNAAYRQFDDIFHWPE